MSWQEYEFDGVEYGLSRSESERFNLSMARVKVGCQATSAKGQDLLVAVGALDADVTVVRFPAEAAWVPAMLANTGRVVLAAGTLTYWEHDAQRPLRDVVDSADLAVTRGGGYSDLPSLVADVVRQSFAAYGNHYSVNPLLSPEAALDGYVDWAGRSVVEDPDSVIVLADEAGPVGVATCEIDGTDAEVLLAGLTPSAQGKRWYSVLLEGSREHAYSRGCRRLVISTQAHNVSVQRAWARLGLRPFGAIETVHLVNARSWRDQSI